MTKLWRARFTDLINSSKEAIDTMELMRQKFNAHITTEDDGTYISFDKVRDAYDWVSDICHKYTDSAIMVGSKRDNLVKKFDKFRMNFQLYHILLYVVEGQLLYNPSTKTWTNLIKKPGAKTSADVMLKNYDLL
jgi:hypothetical protein